MSSGKLWFCTFACAALATTAGTWGYLEHARSADLDKKLALLREDDARLHALVGQQEKSLSEADEAARRKQIEKSVAEIRGLDFKYPVVYEKLARAGFKAILAQKLSEQASDQDFRNSTAGLAALGLLKPGYPLKEEYIALLGEQIMAFYDQHQHKLFMFEDATLTNTQNCVVLAHELTHALQDQHFDLLKTPLEVKNNDDLAMATSALVEGDATMLMSDYMSNNLTLKTLTDNVSSIYTTDMGQLVRAPRYLRELLVFPYMHGKDFCAALYQNGGYDGISAAYKNLPASTTQILHPEKYFAHEMPIRIEWPDTTALGKKPAEDNVLGEFGIRVLFTEWLNEKTGRAAAEGWRGDRYLAYDDGSALVWKTLWEDKEHAQGFVSALETYITRRFKTPTLGMGPGGDVSFSTPAGTGEIHRTENGVIFIWALTKEMNDALDRKFAE